jgi:hypothetical protein
MQIEMDYGRDGLTIDVPDNADIFLVREGPPVLDEKAAIQHALNHPIESHSLPSPLSHKSLPMLP